MIREDLLEFQYYLDRLSMFMKESYGIKEHVELFYRQLKVVNEQYDIFFNNLDIWNNDNIPSKFLDLIGSIFNCYREFTIELNGIYKQINLSDEDFIIYIKCQIVKQNFQGTFEELRRLYTTYVNNEIQDGLLTLQFDYVLYIVSQSSLHCAIYFSNYNSYSQNIQDLFDAGYLTIESMGINYNRIKDDILNVSLFGTDDTLLLSNDDYYKLNGTDPIKYYCWSTISGNWYESLTTGEGAYLGEVDSTSEIPNYGNYYTFNNGRFA